MADVSRAEFDQYIGHRVRQERRLAGMSRSILGEVIGADIETVEKYENGETRMPADHLAKATTALNLSVSMLFYDEGRSWPRTADHTRWIVIRRPPTFFSSPSFARVAPFIDLWKRSKGELTDDIEDALLIDGILDRTIILRRSPASSRLFTEHFGSRIILVRPSDIVGRDVLEQPDPVYARCMAGAYAEVLSHRRVTIDACRAIVRIWDGRTIDVRYDRVLIPWRWRGSDQFAMCFSLRRGHLTEMDSAAAVLPP